MVLCFSIYLAFQTDSTEEITLLQITPEWHGEGGIKIPDDTKQIFVYVQEWNTNEVFQQNYLPAFAEPFVLHICNNENDRRVANSSLPEPEDELV